MIPVVNDTPAVEEEEKKEEEQKEESTENVPPQTSSTSDLKKEGEESKVSLREKPVGARGVTTQSVIVRGGPAGKVREMEERDERKREGERGC